MIHRLHIHGYRSLRTIDLAFPGPLAAVMGPNGAGKSNLFEAIDLVRRLVHSPTLEIALAANPDRVLESFSLSRGADPIGNREILKLGFELDIELSESTVARTEAEIARHVLEPGVEQVNEGSRISERYLRYRLEIEYLPWLGILRVIDEELAALRRDGLPKESRTSFISRVDDGGRKVLRLRLEGRGGHPDEYDVGLPYTVISRPHHPPHYPHIDAFKRELDGWRLYHLDPHRLRLDGESRAAGWPGTHGEHLASYLGTLDQHEPERVHLIARTLKVMLPRVDELHVRRSENGLFRLFLKQDDLELSAQSISEGTLLLIGILAAIQPHPRSTLVCLAEPESGLHPVRIGSVARLLQTAAEAGPTQVLVNTESPILAACLPQKSLFVCRLGTDGTHIEPFQSTGEVMKAVEIQEALNPGDEPEVAGKELVPFFTLSSGT